MKRSWELLWNFTGFVGVNEVGHFKYFSVKYVANKFNVKQSANFGGEEKVWPACLKLEPLQGCQNNVFCRMLVSEHQWYPLVFCLYNRSECVSPLFGYNILFSLKISSQTTGVHLLALEIENCFPFWDQICFEISMKHYIFKICDLSF